jgi:hypothetical protein
MERNIKKVTATTTTTATTPLVNDNIFWYLLSSQGWVLSALKLPKKDYYDKLMSLL